MNSIERVRMALAFQEPDRVPIGEFVIDCDIAGHILGRPTYIRDKVRTQIAYWEGRRDEVVAGLIQDLPELYRKLDIYDVIPIAKMAVVPPKGYAPECPRKIADDAWEDSAGRIYKLSAVTNEISMVRDPTEWTREFSPDQFPADPEVSPPGESVYEVLNAVQPLLPPDRYLIGDMPMATEQALLGGWQRGLVEIADHPETVEACVQSSIAAARKRMEFWRNRGWHGVLNGTDFGHTTGTFVSPAAFRRLFLPAVQANVRAAHERGLHFFQHSCGDNRPILNDLADAGIDCLQSLQPEAGMTPGFVKRATGNRVAAWGGVDLHVLISGTPDDVRAEVRHTMETAKRGGRLILGASQSIGWGTTYDNFMAMLDEYEKTRDY